MIQLKCYKVYSMDFEDLTGRNLVLQAVWNTRQGWQRDMEENEMEFLESEHILYFSHEEFVLTGRIPHHHLPHIY